MSQRDIFEIALIDFFQKVWLPERGRGVTNENELKVKADPLQLLQML